jgi:hypothetical protein
MKSNMTKAEYKEYINHKRSSRKASEEFELKCKKRDGLYISPKKEKTMIDEVIVEPVQEEIIVENEVVVEINTEVIN